MKIIKKIKIFVITSILFFLVTMPFRKLFGMAGLTEVRPASAFPTAFGILFGAAGAFGCAAGNLAADLLSGYPIQVCLYGFIAQFLYGWIPHRMWHWGRKKKEKNGIRFHSAKDVRRYMGIVFLDSLLMAVMLGGMLHFLGLGTFWSQSTLLLFFNNLVFSVLLGIPIILLCSMAGGQERRHVLTLNVRFVLVFLILSMLSAGLMGIASYAEAVHYTKDMLQLWNRVYIRVSVDFFVLCGVSVCFLQYLQNKITIPIEKLSRVAIGYADRKRQVAGSPEDERGESDMTAWMQECRELARLSGEPGYLAAAFWKMMQDVGYYIQNMTKITEEKEKIRTELTVAARLQADMLPETEGAFIDRKEFSIAAAMIPAKGVGGDFYDFFLLDEDRLVLVMADVSGKGVPAALFMVVSRTLIRSHIMGHIMAGHSLEQAVEEINDRLCSNNKNGMFVTAWIGILTLSTGELVFVNAGHCRPLIRKQNSGCYYDTTLGGLVLAGMEGAPYRKSRIHMNKEDILLLYTDGVTEATSIREELYGEGRLKTVAEKENIRTPEELLKEIWDDISRFQQDTEQFDDITMIALTYHGTVYEKKTGIPDMEHIREFADYVEETLREKGVSMKTIIKIQMAVDEIFSNICYYSKAKEVTLGIAVEENGAAENGIPKEREICLYFEDDGIPYNPLERPDPNVEELLEDRKKGGLGIYLVKKRMDWMGYKYTGGKNHLICKKKDADYKKESQNDTD
jgi:Serine phosphatase RsbU, regulator of sigma subunit